MPSIPLLTAIGAEVIGTLGLSAITNTAQPWSVALIVGGVVLLANSGNMHHG